MAGGRPTLISSGSCSRAGTEPCRHHLATVPLNSPPQLVWMQGGLLEPPPSRLPSSRSLASSPLPQVRSPGSSQPEASPLLWLRLHLTAWLSVSASRRSADHYRYQALFPQQNDISAFDPVPRLIFVHFWAFSPRNCSHSGQDSSTAKYTPLFCWWDGNIGINDGGIRIFPQLSSVYVCGGWFMCLLLIYLFIYKYIEIFSLSLFLWARSSL